MIFERRMRTSSQLVTALGFLLLFSTPIRAQQSRISDSLLVRADLQHVVDLQVARDASTLTTMLSDSDPKIRARAAFAMASVQDSSAVPALLNLLADDHSYVREDAAFALGQSSGLVDGQELLRHLSQEPDTNVQRLLIEALGKKGSRSSLVRLVSMPWQRSLSKEVSLTIGRYALRGLYSSVAVDYLIRQLRADREGLRMNAAYFFGRSRQTESWVHLADSVRAILDDMEPSDSTAMYLITGLNRLEDENDTARFIYWLKNATDWRVRVSAARSLRDRLTEPTVRKALFDQLVHPSIHVAIVAAQSLAAADAWSEDDIQLIKQWVEQNAYAWRITTPLILGLARQGETEFVLDALARRRGARHALAYARLLPALEHLPFQEAFDWLVNAAHHTNARVSYAALSTLAARWQNERETTEARDAYFDVFAYGLRRNDQSTTSAVVGVLSDSLFRSYGISQVLATSYQSLQAPKDIDQMTSILEAMGEIADSTSMFVLEGQTDHEHVLVRQEAKMALANISGSPSPPSITVLPQERSIEWDYLSSLGSHPTLIIQTLKGNITLQLDTEQAPLTTQTIVQFAQNGHYNDVPFHRVVPNFVVQGGDYVRKDGFGGPDFSIRSEFTRNLYRRGAIGMASSGKDTEGSQFFITHSMQPHLDGRYTTFGWVVSGMDVVDGLNEDDRIVSVTVVPDTQD